MAQKEFRHFCFTFNNYNKVDWEQVLIQAVNKLEINYIIAGKEIAPSTGTPHLQGYVQLSKKKYFTTIIKHLPGLHITPCLGSSQDNVNYCYKVDENPIEWGILRSIARGRAKQAADWNLLLEKVEQGDLDYVREHHPREYLIYFNTFKKIQAENLKPLAMVRGCYWLYGKPGVGKSRFCHQQWPDAFWKNANKWWDGYKNEKCVVLDDLGTEHLVEYLKRWADRYKITAEVKTSSCALTYDTFVVTSNFTPQELFVSVPEATRQAILRRFVVVEVTGYQGNQCFGMDPQFPGDEIPLDYLLSPDYRNVMTWNSPFD